MFNTFVLENKKWFPIEPVEETEVNGILMPSRDQIVTDWVRKIRNAELEATDIFVLPDFPITELSKQQMLEYRQQLRDLPDNLQYNILEDGQLDMSIFPEQPTVEKKV